MITHALERDVSRQTQRVPTLFSTTRKTLKLTPARLFELTLETPPPFIKVDACEQ